MDVISRGLTRLGRHARRAIGAGLVIAAGGLLLISNASAQERLPRPILNAVARVDGSLRVGIEEAPAVLIGDLASSGEACSKALEAERADGGAPPDWTSLARIVQRGDIPAGRAVIGALSKSRSDLGELRALRSGRWRDRFAGAHELAPAIAQAQKGIAGLQADVKTFGTAFERWEEHDCAGAQEAIVVTNRRIPSAVALVNHGIERMTAALR